jgi:hypothetical protein
MKELLEKWLNKKVHVYLGGLKIAVVILDIKNSYGRTRYQVSPVTGTGEIWVESVLEIA